jgi:hypothetical protein
LIELLRAMSDHFISGDSNAKDRETADPSSARNQARDLEKIRRDYQAHVEEKMLRRHGPPEERENKTHQYVEALVACWTEPEIRRLLKECCSLGKDDILALELLPKRRNLDQDPLHEIIRPYDYFGFSFTIEPPQPGASDRYQISFGEAEGTCGSGGSVEAVPDAEGRLQLTQLKDCWVA